MLYLLLLFLILLMLLTLMILDKDIFSPSFIVCAVFFLSTLGCIVNARYWKTEISMATILVIVGGCLFFSVIGIVCNSCCKNIYGKRNANEIFELKLIKVDNWKIVLILLVNLVLIYLQIKFVNNVIAMASSKSLLSWGMKMEYYRNIVSYDSSNLHIVIPSYINILNKASMILSYIFVYICVNNFLVKKDFKLIKRFNVMEMLPVIAYILFNLVCSSRGAILQIFIATMVMYHLLYHKQNGWNKHYNIKALVKIVVIATVLLIIFVELRDIVGRNYSETAKSPLYYICCYIGGSIHLLDDFIKKPIDGSQIWGKETFYSIIRFIGQRFNIKDWIYISHLEFRYSNGLNVGNIYTAFRKYIYDFGYFGVIWCTALVSFIYNQIYYTIKYSKKRSVLYDISIIFFGYIAYGYFYMSIQEQPLSAILCTTTIIMPILFMLVVYCLKLKVRFLKIRFCRR